MNPTAWLTHPVILLTIGGAVGIGFCGAYTTFSTFEYETLMLIRQGYWGLAIAYVMGSVLAGFVAVAMGVSLAEET